jgi:hypothetical protein
MSDITRTKANVRPLGNCIYSENREAGDTIEAGEVVYLNGTSGWVLADASAAGTLAGEIGMVVSPQDSVDGDTGLSVLLKGKVTGFESMTPGALHYVSDNAGEIADAAGTKTKIVGYADTAEVLFFDPNTPANPS